MYEMDYRTDIVNFFRGALIGEGGRLLERDAYFENFTFWRGAYWRGALIREWALIRSFTVLKGTFQLSVEHSIFHLEFYMSVCVTALLLFKPYSSYYSGFGMLPGQKVFSNSFQLLAYKN